MCTCGQHFACRALNKFDMKQCGLNADAEREVLHSLSNLDSSQPLLFLKSIKSSIVEM